jgi:hypothetical protein
MSIPTDQIAQRFVDAVLDAVPVAGHYGNIAHLQQAGAELQRMVTALHVHTTGGFALSEDGLQGIVGLFSAYDFAAHKESLTRFFGRHLLSQSIGHEGLAWLSQETGWTLESLQHFTRQAGSAHARSVFASAENLWTGIKHALMLQKGTAGRNWGAGLLAWGGLVAGADALRRGIIGASVAVEEDDGTMTTQTQSQPGKAIVEGALAGTAIAAALKIAERNTLGLK